MYLAVGGPARGLAMTTTIIALVLVAVFVLSAGCARSDWIGNTLVTVDVTGVWVGSMGTSNAAREVRLELVQQGPKVKGQVRQVGAGLGGRPWLAGPLEGDIGGDVLTFRLTNG